MSAEAHWFVGAKVSLSPVACRALLTTVSRDTWLPSGPATRALTLRTISPKTKFCLGKSAGANEAGGRSVQAKLRFSRRMGLPSLPTECGWQFCRVETTRRVLRSRSETFYYETIHIFSSNDRYFLSAQRNHLSLPHLLSRGAFSGDRGAFSTVVPARFPPAEERERELDDAMGLSTRKASPHQK